MAVAALHITEAMNTVVTIIMTIMEAMNVPITAMMMLMKKRKGRARCSTTTAKR